MFFTLFSLIILAAACVFVTRLTSRHGIQPVLIIIPASLVCGIASGYSLTDTLIVVKRGFSETAASAGLVIIFGHLYSMLLVEAGLFNVLPGLIFRAAAVRNVPLALAVTGGLVSIPVHCEAGSMFMWPAAHAVSEKSGTGKARGVISLLSGMYITSLLVVPTAGPLAAAGILNADIFILLFLGLCVSIPALLAAVFVSGRIAAGCPVETCSDRAYTLQDEKTSPGISASLIFIFMPLALISMKAVSLAGSRPFGSGMLYRIINFSGDPATAAMICTCLMLMYTWRKGLITDFKSVAQNSIGRSLNILLLAASAGALAASFRTSSVMGLVPDSVPHWCGLLVPFIAAALFKTLHGSSLIAMITACSMTSASVAAMRLSPELAVLAAGAGAMVVSHVNDPYFWIVSGLTGMPVKSTLRHFSLVVCVCGVVSMIIVLLLGLFL